MITMVVAAAAVEPHDKQNQLMIVLVIVVCDSDVGCGMHSDDGISGGGRAA